MSRFDRIGRRRRRQRLGFLLVLSLVLAGAVYFGGGWRVNAIVRSGQDALLAGDMEEAAARMDAAGFYRLRPGRVLEGQAVVHLAGDRLQEAGALLDRAREAGVAASALDLELVAEFLADTARYQAVQMLAEHRQQSGGDEISPLWQGEAALALDRLERAATLLERAVSGPRTERVRQMLQDRKASGTAFSIVDRHGRPVYGRSLKDGSPVLEVPEFGAAVSGPGGLLESLGPRALSGRVQLTLDLAYEKAAHAALGRYEGAFVALAPATGEVLALVNHAGEGTAEGAHRQLFEPGSIIKMITLAAAVEAGIDLDALFPINCTGNMTLDNKVFYDWTVHGTVVDANHATAVSCNLAFAALGLELGQARLDDALRRFGFDAALRADDQPLPMGRLLDVDPATPRLGLARRAVGLGNIQITPLHLALVAAAFAHGGTAMEPRLVASRAALGSDEPYAVSSPRPLLPATDAATSGIIREAMGEVISFPQGTGRRAAIPELTFAMKTGTAGERQSGLNSVIFGFAPAENPQVAFGFVALHAGKAELEGARIVRDFLVTVRNEFGKTP